jgi:hypothetical protein
MDSGTYFSDQFDPMYTEITSSVGTIFYYLWFSAVHLLLLDIKHVNAEYVYLLLPNNILQHKYFAARGNARAQS